MKWLAFGVAMLIIAPVAISGGLAGVGIAALALFVFAPFK